MICGRNVFLKYGLGAKRLSEIWFGCETSIWNMVWVRNVFLKYGLGATRLPELWRRGRNVFPIYGEGAKRLSQVWVGGETSHWKMVRTDYGAKSLCTVSDTLYLSLWRHTYSWRLSVTSYLLMTSLCDSLPPLSLPLPLYPSSSLWYLLVISLYKVTFTRYVFLWRHTYSWRLRGSVADTLSLHHISTRVRHGRSYRRLVLTSAASPCQPG